jgi:hypothetical protein
MLQTCTANVESHIGEDPTEARHAAIDPHDAELQRQRERLYGDSVTKSELIKVSAKSRRTIDRYIAQGMPYFTILGEKRFNLNVLKDWNTRRTGSRLPPRSRGRPRNEDRGLPKRRGSGPSP